MAYVNPLKVLFKFDDFNLSDSVSGRNLSPIGNESVDVLSDGLGYVMKQDQYLQGANDSSGGFSLGINKEMIIGFWLYPVNPGQAVNPDTGALETIRMPLLDIIPFNETISEISIKEHTLDDDTNFLSVQLDNSSYTQTSSAYDVGAWHYFWIVYRGSEDPSYVGDKLDIYVDGTLCVSTSSDVDIPLGASGVLPASLNAAEIDLYINRYFLDIFGYRDTTNYGYIDDIVIFNSDTGNSDKYMQKIINYSIDFAVDVTYQYAEKYPYGFSHDDPATIRVNSLIDDMSFVYLARNDGKIMRGSPLFWESRKNFSDTREKDLLDETITGDDKTGGIIMENGFMKIKSSIVRL